MQKIIIGALEETLKNAGIEEVKLEPKEGGIYWLRIKEGFKIAKNEAGIILNINGFQILVKNYYSLFPPRENNIKKSLFLKPIRA